MLPNVTIRILPPVGNHRLAVDFFSILEFGGSSEVVLHDLVSLEGLIDGFYVEDGPDTHQFRLAFERLIEESLAPAESLELMLTTARRLWMKA